MKISSTFWHFNTALLEEQTFREVLRVLWVVPLNLTLTVQNLLGCTGNRGHLEALQRKKLLATTAQGELVHFRYMNARPGSFSAWTAGAARGRSSAGCLPADDGSAIT